MTLDLGLRVSAVRDECTFVLDDHPEHEGLFVLRVKTDQRECLFTIAKTVQSQQAVVDETEQVVSHAYVKDRWQVRLDDPQPFIERLMCVSA